MSFSATRSFGCGLVWGFLAKFLLGGFGGTFVNLFAPKRLDGKPLSFHQKNRPPLGGICANEKDHGAKPADGSKGQGF